MLSLYEKVITSVSEEASTSHQDGCLCGSSAVSDEPSEALECLKMGLKLDSFRRDNFYQQPSQRKPAAARKELCSVTEQSRK